MLTINLLTQAKRHNIGLAVEAASEWFVSYIIYQSQAKS